jgi:hypothetical protein
MLRVRHHQEGASVLAKFVKWLSAWKLFKALRKDKPDQES